MMPGLVPNLPGMRLACSLAIVAVVAPSLRAQAQPTIQNVAVPGALFANFNVVAPGEVVDVEGNNFVQNGFPMASVEVNGVNAPSMALDTNSLLIEIPPQTAVGSADIVVSVNGVSSAPSQFMVRPFEPAVFTFPTSYIAGYHGDGTEISAQSPAKVGETITALITGIGNASPPPAVTVIVGGFPAAGESIQPVERNGLPGYDLVAFAIPPYLSSGVQTVVVSVGNVPSNTVTIPVVATGLILSQTGETFQAVSRSATTFQQDIFVIATNQVVNWAATASTISGGDWLQVTPATGTSDPAQSPPSIHISASAQNLAPGSYYGEVTVSPVNTNSAQTITVVLNVLPGGQSPGIELQPTGLLFTSAQGAAAPSAQAIQVINPTTGAVSFSGAASVPSGSQWFQFSPEKGTVTPGQPVAITVQPSTSLPSGIYPGSISFQFSDGSQRVLSLLWVVASGGNASSSNRRPSSAGPLATTTCTPSKLEPLFTQLGVNFSSPVAWPTQIQASIVDDCGNPLTSGSVSLSFSNGDPILGMSPVQGGTWTATWTPINPVTSSLVVTLTAQQITPPIQGTAQVSGAAPANPLVPIVNSGGVVSTASYAASPAPGTLISIFGTELAGSTAQAHNLPLPDQIETTQLAIGGVTVPLLFVSANQVNALVPYGLQSNAKYSVIVERGTAISSAQTISVQAALPGIFTPDQSGKGQGYIFKIASDGAQTLAAPGAPATAGDVITIYCAGLGAVEPSLQAGVPAPSTTLENTVNPVTATIGGVNASVAFGGLTPGFVGLYQVNLTVPSGVAPGNGVPVILSVAGESSVPVTMAVH